MSEQNKTREYFIKACERFNLALTDNEISKFFEYKDLLISWNKKINLTSITDEKDILLKHFVDSMTISGFIQEGAKVIDVGTGAGFPGLPLKIIRPSIELTLLDSLKKRIAYLETVVDKLQLKDVTVLNGRAETAAHVEGHRESYDAAVSRAVAPLNILAEYCLPFVKIGGVFIAMKGSNGNAEIEEAVNAFLMLGGRINRTETFRLGIERAARTVIEISKIENTPKRYPRKEGTPAKKPLK